MDLRKAFLEHELESIVGPEHVVTEPAEMVAQTADVWWITRFLLSSDVEFPRPFAIVFPGDKAEVIKLVQFCGEHKVPLVPRGVVRATRAGRWRCTAGSSWI